MKNGLELNSIIYSNLQTNKSNIAQGQNAFYVSKSKTKEQAIKRSPTFHSIQYFWATSSKTLWWSECGLETSFSCRAPSLDLRGQSQSGSSCLWLFPGSPACRHVSTSPVSSPTQDVAFAFQEFPETGKKKKKGSVSMSGSFGVKRETSLNIAVLYIWLNFTNRPPFDLCLFVDVRMWEPVGSEQRTERIVFTKGKHQPHLPHFQSLPCPDGAQHILLIHSFVLL